MVTFPVFWERVRKELDRLPLGPSGARVLRIQKWSAKRGRFGSAFAMLYHGGNTFVCETASGTLRTGVSRAEFRKVYEAWEDYRRGRVGRSYIVHDLGVQNSSWIIPILHHFEHLMD